MRRARIKAVANVPIRRKNTSDVCTEKPENVPSSKNKDKTNDEPSSITPKLSTPDQKPIVTIEKQNSITSKEQAKQISTESHDSQSQDHEIDKTAKSISEEDSAKTVSNNAAEKTESNSSRCKDSAASPSKIPPPNIEPKVLSITEPMSPSKLFQNRSSFMRPVPRLVSGGGRIRRNSVQGSGASASESEDDTRRSNSVIPNRVRNDSICSIQSNKETTGTNIFGVSPQKKLGQKKRMVVSESSRKLAEARREFQLKHENKIPERNKLTMYDLIYYNPVTNPMKRQNDSASIARRISVSSTATLEDEENADEPTAMPVPQVKVGPDGQLIIDEQSLVIEHTDAKKNRDALANSEAVIDEGVYGNGFYKRRQKSKKWSKWETLKFYKTLNHVGTDFSLMQSAFPERSRQEIKLKFKKEEKINGKLVEKALKYPQEFDTEILEKELATFEEPERKELESKERSKQDKEKPKGQYQKKRVCRLVASSIAEAEGTDNEGAPESEKSKELSEEGTLDNSNRKKPKRRNKRKRQQSIENALDEIISQTSDVMYENSDSEPEVYRVKKTRSGRLPRVRKLQAPNVNTVDQSLSDDAENTGLSSEYDARSNPELSTNITEALADEEFACAETPKVIEHAIPDMSQVEPGSLVILSSESTEEPGKTILQVYMVSPSSDSSDPDVKKNMTPIHLSPELLATVTTRMSQVQPISMETE